MIILPPGAALAATQEAIEKGTKGIVIVSAGFREVGKDGLDVENKIVSLCRQADVRLVGPNCLGVINPLSNVRLNASFSARMPKAGNISFISQSGALCAAVLDFAADRDFGFSKFISIGNKADVDELDLLRYFHEDEDTEVIMLYLEELRRGPEFIEAVKEITSGDFRPTPILVIKSGRTGAGAQAAASHTGALAGTEGVYDAIFKQSGIIRVDSINELFDFATAFAYKNESALGKLRRKVPDGNRIAIVTNAGGPGVMAADHCTDVGLTLAELAPATVEALDEALPPSSSRNNPVDVLGDAGADRYESAVKLCLEDKGIDAVLVILTPQAQTAPTEVAEKLCALRKASRKPILACWMGSVSVAESRDLFRINNIPYFSTPEAAVRAFGALSAYHDSQQQLLQVPEPLNRDSEPEFDNAHRSEERRVGKECRSRWSPYH